MSDRLITALVGILTGVVGLAALSVLVSNQAQTGSVISAGAQGFSSILKAAVSPVSGGGLAGNVWQ